MFYRPDTVDDALLRLQEQPCRILAGGTDVFPALQNRPLDGAVLDLSRIGSLRQISQDDAGWMIGAGVTWSDLVAAPLPPAFDALKQAAIEIGSPQIQNRATLAGNLCNASPAADGVPALLILDASVQLRSPRGTRLLPLESFILGNRRTAREVDELVSAIHVPKAATAGQSHFSKLGARRYLVISIAMLAIRLVAEGGHISACAIAVGACSPVAKRLRRLEAQLHGASLGMLARDGFLPDSTVLSDLGPIDDVRATAAYRLEAVRELLQRALRDLAGSIA